MAADASTLRSLLSRVDGTAPSIHNAAGAMMKHYDRSASVAVQEWRNSLQAGNKSQLLPLLYVANEVLQNSKRNRGNKFLEAFSPVLGQSLSFICQSDPSLTEKVRRTAKIWGDRRVLSIRFVNELLLGLEEFRGGKKQPQSPYPQNASSPAALSPGPSDRPTPSTKSATSNDDDDDDILDFLASDDDHVEEDDDDIFGANDSSQKLEIEINVGSALLNENSETTSKHTTTTPSHHRGSNSKRRRSSLSTSSQGNNKRKHSLILSTSNFSDMWTQLAVLQQRLDGAEESLSRIDQRHQTVSHGELEHMVGDELQQAYMQNERDHNQMVMQRITLHSIAEERKQKELEAMRYLVWLEAGLKQDEEDMAFCDQLEQKILSFKDIHAAMREARDKRVAEEQKKRKEKEERDRRQKEKEEQEKFKRQALARETEAKPGMVWNRATREYQPLNTDETWRE